MADSNVPKPLHAAALVKLPDSVYNPTEEKAEFQIFAVMRGTEILKYAIASSSVIHEAVIFEDSVKMVGGENPITWSELTNGYYQADFEITFPDETRFPQVYSCTLVFTDHRIMTDWLYRQGNNVGGAGGMIWFDGSKVYCTEKPSIVILKTHELV